MVLVSTVLSIDKKFIWVVICLFRKKQNEKQEEKEVTKGKSETESNLNKKGNNTALPGLERIIQNHQRTKKYTPF